MKTPRKVKVFIDADVIFAGSASPTEHSASNVILRMAEITLIDAVTSQQAITEAERNLALKLPEALPVFGLLVSRSLRVTPSPTVEEAKLFSGLAGPKDVSILAAAVREQCEWLVTFNIRYFAPGHPGTIVLRPGEFIYQVRDRLAQLTL
jgi:predicted nucleic acid-binding protein